MQGQPVVLLCLLLVVCRVEGAVDYACVHRNSWRLLNAQSTKAPYFPLAAMDVNSAKVDDALTGFRVQTDGIPSYSTKITTSMISTLSTRPKKTTDFSTGSAPTCAVGDTIPFGKSIGYSSSACSMGYWPPGPVCPSKTASTSTFTLTPAAETSSSGCYAGTGAIGKFVNGVSIFNGGDTNTYNNQGTWYSTAMSHEVYDLDVCLGHAAMGEYHHHSWSPCLAKALGDEGYAHSPIYGWIVDGFPIHGPYNGNQVLAKSCWKKRDYSTAVGTAGGWGCGDQKRSCVLKDQTNPSAGVDATVSAGPDPASGTVTTLSGNSISASTGFTIKITTTIRLVSSRAESI